MSHRRSTASSASVVADARARLSPATLDAQERALARGTPSPSRCPARRAARAGGLRQRGRRDPTAELRRARRTLAGHACRAHRRRRSCVHGPAARARRRADRRLRQRLSGRPTSASSRPRRRRPRGSSRPRSALQHSSQSSDNRRRHRDDATEAKQSSKKESERVRIRQRRRDTSRRRAAGSLVAADARRLAGRARRSRAARARRHVRRRRRASAWRWSSCSAAPSTTAAWPATGSRCSRSIFAYPLTFLSVFLNTAIAAAAAAALEGRRLSLGQALAVPVRRIGAVAVWALIAAVVGFVLEQLASRLPLGGSIAARLRRPRLVAGEPVRHSRSSRSKTARRPRRSSAPRRSSRSAGARASAATSSSAHGWRSAMLGDRRRLRVGAVATNDVPAVRDAIIVARRARARIRHRAATARAPDLRRRALPLRHDRRRARAVRRAATCSRRSALAPAFALTRRRRLAAPLHCARARARRPARARTWASHARAALCWRACPASEIHIRWAAGADDLSGALAVRVRGLLRRTGRALRARSATRSTTRRCTSSRSHPATAARRRDAAPAARRATPRASAASPCSPHWRRRGIASRMLALAVQRAAEEGHAGPAWPRRSGPRRSTSRPASASSPSPSTRPASRTCGWAGRWPAPRASA